MSVYRRKGAADYTCDFIVKGHRTCRSTGCTTEREAKQFERRLKAEKRAEIRKIQPRTRMTLDQGFGLYLKEKAPAWSASWLRNASRYMTDIVTRVEDPDKAIEDITSVDVHDYVQERLSEGKGAPYAINRALAVWRGMHIRARKRWGQRTHEIDFAEFMNDEQRRVRFLTHKEASRLIAALPSHIALMVEWSLYTGCRQFETFGLLWDRVHLDKGFATVTAKGGRDHVVWLSTDALDVLSRADTSGRYVFRTTNYRKAFAKALKEIGLENFRWHDLRHTHATWLRQAGAPVEVVQRSLGHAAIGTTMRYAHVADTELQASLQSLPSVSTTGDTIVKFPVKNQRGNS